MMPRAFNDLSKMIGEIQKINYKSFYNNEPLSIDPADIEEELINC